MFFVLSIDKLCVYIYTLILCDVMKSSINITIHTHTPFIGNVPVYLIFCIPYLFFLPPPPLQFMDSCNVKIFLLCHTNIFGKCKWSIMSVQINHP